MGDGSVGLFEFLDKQGWSFVIRMKKDIWCQRANGRRFQIGEIPLRPGTINFEDGVCLVGLPHLRLSLNCGWSSLDPKDEPWYLLTPFRAGKDNLERYSRRFWIEEMFRDFNPPEEIEQQIAWLPYRGAKNPASYLVAAITGSYEEPGLLKVRREQQFYSNDPVPPDEANLPTPGIPQNLT